MDQGIYKSIIEQNLYNYKYQPPFHSSQIKQNTWFTFLENKNITVTGGFEEDSSASLEKQNFK